MGDGGAVASADSSTQLDSHANYWVLSDDCTVFNRYKRSFSVNAFTSEVKALKVPIVDAAMAYDCPFSGDTYIIIMKQGLLVSSMEHHLAPPFILCEAGLEVNDTAKQHRDEPTVEDHSIYDKATGLRIPL